MGQYIYLKTTVYIHLTWDAREGASEVSDIADDLELKTSHKYKDRRYGKTSYTLYIDA